MKNAMLLFAWALLPSLLSAKPSVVIDYRFTDATTNEAVEGQASTRLPPSQGELSYTDARMAKTIQVIGLANLIGDHLDEYGKARCVESAPTICEHWPIDAKIQSSRKLPAKTCEEKMRVAGDLAADLQSYRTQLNRFSFKDPKLDEALAVTTALVENMKENARLVDNPCYQWTTPEIAIAESFAVAPSMSMSILSSGLHVTTGGAQNYAFFKKIVEEGGVPENLVVEGFLSEFDLSLAGEACDKLICVYPEVAVGAKKLFVQVAMASRERAKDFQRKPLNLSIVLDISGSMSATNGTKQSRLDWAKEALRSTVSQLHGDDMLSIVLFETESQILLQPALVSDKEAIFAAIKDIQTLGSTNLEAGLRDGYELVSANVSPAYENRVILISDAGLNTGVTDTSEILRLITDNATDDIGLTAIGMGLNFNEDLIHAISRSRGGNYLFVQSGDGLADFFANFDYLVTPIAYAFKASLTLNGIDAQLARTYGIPRSDEANLKDLFDIQTLFFSKAAGGAIVLEYDLTGKGPR